MKCEPFNLGWRAWRKALVGRPAPPEFASLSSAKSSSPCTSGLKSYRCSDFQWSQPLQYLGLVFERAFNKGKTLILQTSPLKHSLTDPSSPQFQEIAFSQQSYLQNLLSAAQQLIIQRMKPKCMASDSPSPFFSAKTPIFQVTSVLPKQPFNLQ